MFKTIEGSKNANNFFNCNVAQAKTTEAREMRIKQIVLPKVISFLPS